MLTEQQIIELARIEANEVYEDYISFTREQLNQFSYALHAKFIKSLGEPLGYTIKSDLIDKFDNCCLNLDVFTESDDTSGYNIPVYALPNDEVK